MIANSSRLNYEERPESSYRVRMVLTIGYFRKSDVGRYECRCRNEHGEAEGTIKLHGESILSLFHSGVDVLCHFILIERSCVFVSVDSQI